MDYVEKYFTDESIKNYKLMKKYITHVDINIPRKFNKIYNKLKRKKYAQHVIKKTIKLNIDDNPFMSKKIKNLCEMSLKNYTQILLNHITINIYHNNDMPNIDALLDICLWMSNLRNNNKKILIYIYYIDVKKQLDDSITIKRDHVNSGSSNGNRIIIWRKEELLKVLIHELIHYLDYDFKYASIFNIYNVNQNILVNEAYVDAWAIILHTMYLHESETLLGDVFKFCLLYELNFSVYQAAKILKHYGFLSINDLGRKQIMQNTAVFSYYIIKSCFLFCFNQFMDFCLSDTFDFNEIVDKLMHNKIYIKKINKLLLLENFDKNLRMSISEKK